MFLTLSSQFMVMGSVAEDTVVPGDGGARSSSHRRVGRGQVVFSPDCRPGRRAAKVQEGSRVGFTSSIESVIESTYPVCI